ncbi:MAG: ABC transporter ATP-binding protein, partial [Planctomycetia bacterium]
MSARKQQDEEEDELVASKAWDSAILRRLAREARAHRGLFLKSFLVLATLFALDLAGPYVWRHALDGPVRAAVEARAADPGVDTDPQVMSFLRWIGLYLFIVLCAVWMRYLEVSTLNRTGQAVVHDLRVRLFRHLQSLDLSFFDRRPTGSLVTRVTSDVENLNEMFTSGLITLAFDALKVIVLLALLYALEWRLALVVTLGTPFLILVSMVFRGGARSAHRKVRARLSRLNGYLQEVLQGMRVVQLFGREQRVSQRFAGHLASYLQANLRTIFLFALFFPVIDFVVSAIQGSTLWVGGLEIAGASLSYGEFVQFWFYLAMLVSPIRELGERYNVLQSAFASAERIFDVLDTQPKLLPAQSGTSAQPIRGHIRFEAVSFGYLDGLEVVRDISFEIRPGETVAIVGATGAGKSTLINLLLRYYDPSRGRVLLDGLPLAAHDPESLRRSIGLVLQEDFLFAGTIRENLVMERAEVTPERLTRALEASHAREWIETLPRQLEEPVVERGASFSTGQRQLLAIARALAGDPRIVILDEATSSVDSNTEARIEEATRELLRGRSALVVAHRLSTVRRADRILLLHKGQLRERGTHEQLLEQDGIYARLYRLQFAEAAGG